MNDNTPVKAAPAEIAAIEAALVGGDLAKLTPQQRVVYYNRTCESLGLNPLTKPFSYLALNGKLVLYATRDCTDQLRSNRQVSISDMQPQQIGDLYVVRVTARMPDGRTDAATGAVCIEGLRGEKLANAMMKAETKAKRRATLSICGLGLTDESEVETIEGARTDVVDVQTGEPRAEVAQKVAASLGVKPPAPPSGNGGPKQPPCLDAPNMWRLEAPASQHRGKDLLQIETEFPGWIAKVMTSPRMAGALTAGDKAHIAKFAESMGMGSTDEEGA